MDSLCICSYTTQNFYCIKYLLLDTNSRFFCLNGNFVPLLKKIMQKSYITSGLWILAINWSWSSSYRYKEYSYPLAQYKNNFLSLTLLKPSQPSHVDPKNKTWFLYCAKPVKVHEINMKINRENSYPCSLTWFFFYFFLAFPYICLHQASKIEGWVCITSEYGAYYARSSTEILLWPIA